MPGKNGKAKKPNMAKQKPKQKVRTPRAEAVALVSKSGPRIPKTVSSGNGTVVTHTETYGVNVTGSDPFTVFATWALQPGLKSYSRGSPLGQWLPEIAQNFDNYEIESLRFKFRSACSTLTTGLAVFGFEPNPEGSAPATYQEMRNMYSVDGSVHANLTFDVSSRVRKKLLIRKGSVVNLPSYDAGKVYFSTIGVGGNALIGFVDVEYRIRLMNPQSSVTSTVQPLVNPLLPLPTQRWTQDMSIMTTTNCATDCDGLFSWFLTSTSAVNQGAQLTTFTARNSDALNTTVGSCKYVCPARTVAGTLRFAFGGRYRVTFTPRVDYEDLKMFCFAPVIGPNTSGARNFPTYQVYGDPGGGSVINLPIQHYTHRGFTGTAINDPNPGTDVWPTYTWVINVAPDDDFHIMCGVLTYNSVSTTTANVIGRANLGVSELLIELLGNAVEVP